MARPRKLWFRKQTQTWHVQIDGKQHNLRTADKERAEAEFHKLMVERHNAPSDDHLVPILDKFLGWVQSHQPKSYRWYRDYIQSFVSEHPRLLASELKPIHVEEWASKGKAKRAKITAMKRALNWATEMQLVPYSPIAKMKRPAVGSRNKMVTEDEFRELLGHIPQKCFRDLIEFSWETGARPQEVKNIEDRHVDFDKSCVVLPHSEAKGDKTRVVFLTDRAIELLRENWQTGVIFRNSRNEPWTSNAVRSRFLRLEDKLGKRYWQYLFRHAWITRKLKAGVDSHVVAALAGHSDTKIIDRVYSHVSDDHEFMLKQARVGETAKPPRSPK
jgi:integrase